MGNPADLLRWGAWRPLAAASRDPEIPHRPGLYRIRRIGRDDFDYIGQTGMGTMTLRKRLGMLRGVRAATALTDVPVERSSEAFICRRSCSRIRGTPARAMLSFEGSTHIARRKRRPNTRREHEAGFLPVCRHQLALCLPSLVRS
jgi:hypothetical protein